LLFRIAPLSRFDCCNYRVDHRGVGEGSPRGLAWQVLGVVVGLKSLLGFGFAEFVNFSPFGLLMVACTAGALLGNAGKCPQGVRLTDQWTWVFLTKLA
jgi:hypothetical protein